MSRPVTFWRDRSGASAVEFGLLLPMFVMLIVGTLGVSQLMFAVNSLHFAVEEAARCGAVDTTACGSLSQTEAFARSRYKGPQVAATFVATDANCGRRVQVTGAYQLQTGVATLDIPLTAESCFAAPLAT